MKLPMLLSYGEEVYRPAGYRVPHVGELYVGMDGHLKTAQKLGKGQKLGSKLVVRVFCKEDFNE